MSSTWTSPPVFAIAAKTETDTARTAYLGDLYLKTMTAMEKGDAEHIHTAKQLLEMEVSAEVEQRFRAEREDEEEFKGLRGSMVEVDFHEPDTGETQRTTVVTAAHTSYLFLKKHQPRKSAKKPDPFLTRQFFRIWAVFKFFQAIINYRFDEKVCPHLQTFIRLLSGPGNGICATIVASAKGASAGYPAGKTPNAIGDFSSRMDDLLHEIVLSLTGALDFLVGAGSPDVRTHFMKGVYFLEALLFAVSDQTMDQSWFSDIPFPASVQVPFVRTTPQTATMLLTELIAEYSEPKFHQEYINRRNNPAAIGDSHVEHALTVQSKVISRYGFQGSLMGVMEMRRNVEFYVGPPTNDVCLRKLLMDIHEILNARQALPEPARWKFEVGWRPPRAQVPAAAEDAKAERTSWRVLMSEVWVVPKADPGVSRKDCLATYVAGEIVTGQSVMLNGYEWLEVLHEGAEAWILIDGSAVGNKRKFLGPCKADVAAKPACGVVGETAVLVQTVRDTYDRLSIKDSLSFVDNFEFSGPTVSVSINAVDQEIVGFGGAFTEASALVFKGLSEELQKEVLELYFGADGIGYNACRVHINSCDFSMGNYSFDDVEDDFHLEHFDMNVTHDTEAIIPFVKAARQKVAEAGYASDGLRLLASPWSPPPWMKTNGKMNGSNQPGLRADCQAAWARYFVRWISAYQAHGVPMWAITVQNEPQHCAPWDACHYTAEQEADFLGSHLGPTLRANHPEVLIFAFDHNKNNVREWARVTYKHKTAAQYVDGVAFHWYTGDYFDNVRRLHREFPKALLLATEQCYESRRFTPGKFEEGHWRFGEGYAHDILGDLNAGASGWMDWNLMLDINGGPNHVGNFCDAPIITTKPVGEGGELRVHPQYFFMGHFSKYIPAGSRRLITTVDGSPNYAGPERNYGTCTAEDGMQATAFLRPDGVVAVVVMNCCDMPMNFKLEVASRALKARIPPHSIQTYLFPCRVKMPAS